MAREQFVEKRFCKEHQAVIAHANVIIAEMQAQGFTMTLRQLYYQFVARDIIKNNMKEYKRLGSIIDAGRLAGFIDWDAIEDRTRSLSSPPSWDNPQHILKGVAHGFRLDPWIDQEVRLEVWPEKEALAGVFDKLCQKHRIPVFCCRGYVSQSAQYEAGKRFAHYIHGLEQRVVVLHFGDHDPSGLDMSRDNRERLQMFSQEFGKMFELKRLALNMSQIEEHEPPPNPAKNTDSRFEKYADEYGEDSWELDALSPTTLSQILDKQVSKLIDKEAWDKTIAEETKARVQLAKLTDKWPNVAKFLNKKERKKK